MIWARSPGLSPILWLYKIDLDMKETKPCLFSFVDDFLRKETHLEETCHIYHLKVVYD